MRVHVSVGEGWECVCNVSVRECVHVRVGEHVSM